MADTLISGIFVNLWDTGYLVKKLQGYGILRPPLMGCPFNNG